MASSKEMDYRNCGFPSLKNDFLPLLVQTNETSRRLLLTRFIQRAALAQNTRILHRILNYGVISNGFGGSVTP